MPRDYGLAIATASLLLVTGTPVLSRTLPQKGKEVSRRDWEGNPLPVRALARMGSSRLHHAHGVASVLFSADGKMVISAGKDGFIRFSDAATGQELWHVQKPAGVTGDISCIAACPQGRLFAAYMGGPEIHVWDLPKRAEKLRVKTTAGVPHRLGFSGDGTILAALEAGQFKTGLVLYDSRSGKRASFIEGQLRFAFSPDGKLLATAGLEQKIVLREPRAGEVLRRIPALPVSEELSIALGGAGPYLGVALGLIRSPFSLPDSFPDSLAFSPDSKTLAVAYADDTLLCEVRTGRQLVALVGWSKPVFSADGKMLALSSSDRAALWKWTVEKTPIPLTQSRGYAAAAFSPDGARLATAEVEDVHVWDTATGTRLLPSRHTSAIAAIAFSPDGQTVVSAAADNTVRGWDVATGQSRFALTTDTRPSTVAYSPDGNVLAAGTPGCVYLWRGRRPPGHARCSPTSRSATASPTLAWSCSRRTARPWRRRYKTAPSSFGRPTPATEFSASSRPPMSRCGSPLTHGRCSALALDMTAPTMKSCNGTSPRARSSSSVRLKG